MRARWRAVTAGVGALLAVAGLGAVLAGAAHPARPPQAFLARQFLLRALAGRPRAVNAALAPGAALSEKQVAERVGQLRRQARRWGPAIELYKLGWRLPEGQPALLFYQFTFAADSARPGPHVLLDVTFRDSLATQPLGFGLVLRLK